MACKQEKSLDKGEFGIKVFGYGPAKTPKGSWDFFYMPVPTDICDLCIERTATGKVPACVHHCQPKVMEYGPIDELSKKLADIKKCVLFAPGLD